MPSSFPPLKFNGHSKSENHQDFFALVINSFCRGGWFVDVGAADGVEGSNSYLLERYFGWRGVLVDPCRESHPMLCRNRTGTIDLRCVFSETGSKQDFYSYGGLSTVTTYIDSDRWGDLRRQGGGETYAVETVTLHDLLRQHSAPSVINYLSLDTEGTEYEILKNFPFENYIFKAITVEHNYTQNRERIYNLLSAVGYSRVYQDYSKNDDWYCWSELLN